MEEIKFKAVCKNMDGSIETSQCTLEDDNEFKAVNSSTPAPGSEVTVSEIDSENQPSGKTIVSDGSGGASWEDDGTGGGSLYKHTLTLTDTYSNSVEVVIISNNSQSYGSNTALSNIAANLFQDLYLSAKVKQDFLGDDLYFDTLLSLWTDPNEGDTFFCVQIAIDSINTTLCPTDQIVTDTVTEL